MSVVLKRKDSDAWLEGAVNSEPWDYLEADTQSLTHNIHRYSGKFIPQIAARVIEMLSKPHDFVLDPYCGSGTVLVEAALLGRQALGVDLNPLAVLIAQTKIKPVPRFLLRSLRKTMDETIERLDPTHAWTLFDRLQDGPSSDAGLRSDPRLLDSWFRKWFRAEVLRDLIAIERAIQQIEDLTCRNIALVAFSDILRKSSNAHSGYPNVMFDKHARPRARPGKSFLRALDRLCTMVETLETAAANWEQVGVQLGSATKLRLEDHSVDLIVSHPPYIGSIPYAEYGALSLKWLGVDPKSLDRELTGGRRQASDVVERFRADYAKMLHESYRVLREGSYAFLMVGNPVVRGNVIDLAAMTIELATNAGFSLRARTERQAVNRRANKMGGEHLLFFQKHEELAWKTAR